MTKQVCKLTEPVGCVTGCICDRQADHKGWYCHCPCGRWHLREDHQP